MVNMTSCPCVFPPDSPWFLSPQRHPACLHNLLESTACHRLGLLACHGADQPCVAATWRPVWQLTSITVTLSHSRPITSMIYSLENGAGLCFRAWSLFSWFKISGNFIQNEWLSLNDHNSLNKLGDLLQTPSLWLFVDMIIVENGGLDIQPEGKKASEMSLY